MTDSIQKIATMVRYLKNAAYAHGYEKGQTDLNWADIARTERLAALAESNLVKAINEALNPEKQA